MINTKNKNCMGCGACLNVCPVNAIKMTFDEKGFYLPQVDEEKCIKCGKCLKVCAALDYESNNKEPQVYAVAAHDEERIHSTSGGAFAVFAKYVLKNNGYVCGVAWADNWEAKHVIIDKVEDLSKLRFSKYVQATTGDSYKKIKDLLENGKTVLFSGTPCQNAGLSKFLNKNYSNLITVDILCHGAPSPKVWQDYLKENYDINQISKIQFRTKDVDWNLGCIAGAYDTKGGFIQENNERKQVGIYYEAFLKHILSNDACMECKYKHIPRPADFTLGDFWYLRNNSKYDSKKGLSVLLLNNKKAESLFKNLSRDFKICKKINLKKKWNKIEISSASRETYARKEFFENYKKGKPLNKILNTAIGKKYDVALLTMCNVMNYGSALVAYSANQIIKELGYSTVFINKELNTFDTSSNNISSDFAKRTANLTRFFKHDEDCSELNDIADAFVVCSDTMWWDTELALDWAYLDFVNAKNKKISFCTSFGHPEPVMNNRMKDKRRYLLNRFDALSTREESGVRNLKEIFNVESTHLFDPTLIAEKKIFDDLASKSSLNKKNYMFAYLLDLTEEKEKVALHIAKSLGLELKLISNMRYHGRSKLVDEKNISIEDFVYYCKNADFILTDSFHGSCFSIIYQKPFISLVNSWRGQARYKIFEDMGLASQIIYDANKVFDINDFKFNIDYSIAEKRLSDERNKALKWLKNALSIDKSVLNKSDLLYDYLYLKEVKQSDFNAVVNTKIKYNNIAERIFSVKNQYSNNKKRKVLTFLNIKIKFKA